MDSPLVTVLMPVYNAAGFLKKAIESILFQSYKNIEFLIINDGSTDSSLEIIKSYKDNRIKLIENKGNKGLIYSLNIGIQAAKGKYVARMDADDISFAKRIEKQCLYMETHSNVGILGTYVQKGSKFKMYKDLTSNDLKGRVVFNNVFNHPTVMFRCSFLKDNKILYDYNFPHGEDYYLWLFAASQTDFAVLREPLLYYNKHENQVSFKYISEQNNSVAQAQKWFLNKLHINYADKEFEIHNRIFRQDYIYTFDFLKEVECWLNKMVENKEFQNIVGKDALIKTISIIWFEICTHFSSAGLVTDKILKNSTVYSPKHIIFKYKVLFNLKNLKLKLIK